MISTGARDAPRSSVGTFWRFVLWNFYGIDSLVMPPILSDPDWKPLYEAALLETDTSKLLERISAARNAILERIEETLRNPSPAEHRIMNDALRNLRRLAEVVTERLAA